MKSEYFHSIGKLISRYIDWSKFELSANKHPC